MSKNYDLIDESTGTFAGWLTQSNDLFDDMTNIIVTVSTTAARANLTNNSTTVGNGHIQGIFSSNVMVINTAIHGGDATSSFGDKATLFVTSNVTIGTTGTPENLLVWGDSTLKADVTIGTATTDALLIESNTNINGEVFFHANAQFDDNDYLKFGDDGDVTIRWDGSDFFTKFESSNANFIIEDSSGNDIIDIDIDASTLTIRRYDDESPGPSIVLQDRGSTPDSANVGGIFFQGLDSGSDLTEYAYIRGIAEDNTNATEDGSLTLYTTIDSTRTAMIAINEGSDAAVSLRYDGSEKLATKTDGVDITGELQSDSLDVDGVWDITGIGTLHANTQWDDSARLKIGSSADFQVYHDATNSHLINSTGELYIQGDGITIRSNTGTEEYITADVNGAVTLYHNDVAKLATTAPGVAITGAATISSTLDVAGESTLASATVSDLTDNRVVIAGTAGSLEDDANLTMDGTTFKVGGGYGATGFSVAMNGNISTNGTLTVDGTSTLAAINASGLASLDGGIDVDGAFTVADSTGNVSTSGTLGVTGTSTLGVINASGLASLDGGIDVDGAFTVADTTGNIASSGTLRITNATESSTSTSGAAVITGGLGVGGKLYVGGVATLERLDITNDAVINGDLNIQGDFLATGSTNMTVNTATFTTMTVIGNAELGDSASDILTITARIDSDIVPSTDSARDLGTNALRFAEAYVDDAFITANVNMENAGHLKFYDTDNTNFVAFKSAGTVASNVIWTLPNTDAPVSGYSLQSNGSGVLSWGSAGATTTSDNSTNAEEQLYFGDITSGAVTAVHHDSDLTYNPSLGRLTVDQIRLRDSNQLNFGADTDAEFYHDGSHMRMDINTGGLYLRDGTNSNATALSFTPTTASLILTNYDPAIPGPEINLRHDSASPAASDEVGQINFQGNDSGDTNTNYAYIYGRIVDPTDLSEDGALLIYAKQAGTDRLHFSANSGVTTLYYNGSAKIATTSTGIDVTGTAEIDALSINGTAVTATAAELNKLDGVTATTAELNILDGVTATTTELNYVDGVTSNIQTQLNTKAPLASPALTGTATAVNLTVTGDLTVNGTTTTLNMTNIVASDNIIELNNGVSSNANDSGIIIERGSTGANAFMGWDESADKFIVGTTTATGSSTGNLTITAGTLVASTFEGNLSGNASTATILQTARTIGGVSFNGSANINLPGVNIAGNQDTSGNAATVTNGVYTTGNQTIGGTKTFSSTISGSINGNAATATTATSATNININATTSTDTTTYPVLVGAASTGNQIPFIDNSDLSYNASTGTLSATIFSGSGVTITGTATATTFSGALSGNASTASKWATGRTIALTGDVTGTSGSFDGSGNLSFSTNIASNVVGASELNVSGNGTNTQFLRSDGDGSFSWVTPTNTTYSAGSGIGLTSTTFSVAAGGGLTQDAGGLSHADTSTISNLTTIANRFVTGLTFDTYGHVTGYNVQALPQAVDTFSDVRFGSLGIGTPASGTTGEIRALNNITAYYSDKRLKDDITPIANALDKIAQISGVTYRSNDIAKEHGYTSDKLQYGVIAQEVEAIMPEIVVPAPFDIEKNEETGEEYSKTGENYKTVQYEKIIPLLIEAIKELKTEIEELKKR